MAVADAESGCSGGDGPESDPVAKACVLDGFSERDETRALMSSLPEVHGDMKSTEFTTERFLGETSPPPQSSRSLTYTRLNGGAARSQFITSCLFSPTVIMDGYQEQPHLLDPHLGTLNQNV